MTKPLSKPRRRRFLRVSLRTLLILITIGCVWLGWKVERARKQKAAVAWVEEMGGRVWYDYQIGEDAYHTIGDPPGPAWLRELIGIDFFSNVDGVALAGNDSLSDVSPLTNFPTLRILGISYIPVSDLSPLEGLTNLEYLRVDDTSLSDLTPLANLKHLKLLDVSNTPITDLTPLANLKHLERLDVSDTLVTDLTPLSNLKRLERLDLSNIAISKEDISTLQLGLRGCLIERDVRSRSD